MAIVSQVTTQPLLLFSSGSQAAFIMSLSVGETVQFEDTVLGLTECADSAAVVTAVGNQGLTVPSQALSYLPLIDLNGSASADAVAVRQGVGAALAEVDFAGESDGSLSGASYRTTGMTGTASGQPNGKRNSINSDSQNLVSAGFSDFMVLRPDSDVQQLVTLEVDLLQDSGYSMTVEVELGSTGVMEPDDTLFVYVQDNGGEYLVGQYSGDIPQATASLSQVFTGPVSVRIESLCGEGNVESHIINSVRIK